MTRRCRMSRSTNDETAPARDPEGSPSGGEVSVSRERFSQVGRITTSRRVGLRELRDL